MEMFNIKAMPGSIPAPNSGSFVVKNKKKNLSSQMGQTDRSILKKNIVSRWLLQRSFELSISNYKNYCYYLVNVMNCLLVQNDYIKRLLKSLFNDDVTSTNHHLTNRKWFFSNYSEKVFFDETKLFFIFAIINLF